MTVSLIICLFLNLQRMIKLSEIMKMAQLIINGNLLIFYKFSWIAMYFMEFLQLTVKILTEMNKNHSDNDFKIPTKPLKIFCFQTKPQAHQTVKRLTTLFRKIFHAVNFSSIINHWFMLQCSKDPKSTSPQT